MDSQKIFNSIKSLVIYINDFCGDEFLNIQLYNRLLEKTTDEHKTSIAKHVQIFKHFVTSNKECIVNNNTDFLEEEIRYSEKVFINFKSVFDSADDDTRQVLFSKLNKFTKLFSKGTNKNFLNDMMKKVEGSIDPNSNNPMDAITNMMSSGVFSEIITGMTQGLQNGDINLGGLFGQMTEMAGDTNIGGESRSGKQKRNKKKKKPKRK